MLEKDKKQGRDWRTRLKIAMPAAGLAMGAACGGAQNGPMSVAADLSPLAGTATTCPNGGQRPCVDLLYPQPTRWSGHGTTDPKNQPYVNAFGTNGTDQQHAYWPREKHYASGDDFPGDSVTIVCQVRGALESGVIDKKKVTTSIWDVAVVPYDPAHVNGYTMQAVEQGSYSGGVERDASGMVTAILAYGSDLLLGNHGSYHQPACTMAQNPGLFPAI